MRLLSLLILLFVISVSYSLWCETGEVNLTLDPNQGDLNTNFNLEYKINVTNMSDEYRNFTSNVTKLTIFLVPFNSTGESEYDFPLSDRQFLAQRNVSLNETGMISTDLKKWTPWTYKVYAYLACDAFCNFTYYCCPCDFKESLILQPIPEITTMTLREKLEPEIIVNILEYPSQVYKDQDFEIKVNVTNIKIDDKMNIYSYVYEGMDVLSKGWTHNRQELKVLSGSSILLTLHDKVIALRQGDYKLKVRVKVGDENYDSIVPIEVLPSKKEEVVGDKIEESREVETTQKSSPITGAAVTQADPKTLYLLLTLFSFVVLIVLIRLTK